ncbi:hypothetical protein F5Y14DRAFT_401003 [Nemania sp. NC0429]|nr:hypothetical protein F5Y14DRAFT_401003 [Nemania sp. NC0429]
MSDDERGYFVSYPILIPKGTLCDRVTRDIDLGKEFLKKGDLKSAETAFIRGQHFLKHLAPHEQEPYEIQIRVQLAGIKLHQGGYKEAEEDFTAVLGDMGTKFNNRERNAIKRWIATSLLRQGQYEQAAILFSSLLEIISAQDPDNLTAEIPIRRDLAFASACQGYYQQALRHMNTAHDCLGQILTNLNASSESLPRDETGEPLPFELDEAIARQISAGDEVQKNELRKSLYLRGLYAKRDQLYLTESKIHSMWGDFEAALQKSEIALRGMAKRWGSGHIKTLECASYHSLFLALNSRVLEAEPACSLTLVETQRRLGPRHPQTLETLGHLVSILLFNARLVEAGDTAKSLAKTTESLLTADHPQTHLSRYRVAETLIAVGDYVSAEVELQGIITDATRVYGAYHRDTLMYRSRLALAKFHIGKIQEAEDLAIHVLQEQQKIYTISKSDETMVYSTSEQVGHHGSVKTLAEYQETLNDLLVSINSNSDDLRIHPYLLQTLRTIALIAEGSDDLGDLALRTFQALWERNKFSLNETSMFTLGSEYDLALAYRIGAKGPDDARPLEIAVEHLRHVHQKCYSILGPEHPGTVSARREFITGRCILGQWEPSLDLSGKDDPDHVPEGLIDPDKELLDKINWGRLEAESRHIVYMHEISGGKNHPETFRSLLWLLTVRVHLRMEKGIDETLRKGLPRFRHASVRRERFVESLVLERKFALAMSGLGDKYDAKALQILYNASRAIRELPETKHGELRERIEALKTDIDDQRNALFIKVSRDREALEAELRLRIERAEEEGSYDDAAAHQAELWSLLASLDDHDNPRTLDAQIKLHEFQLSSAEYDVRIIGLRAMRELTRKYAKALTTGQTQRVEEAMKRRMRDGIRPGKRSSLVPSDQSTNPAVVTLVEL